MPGEVGKGESQHKNICQQYYNKFNFSFCNIDGIIPFQYVKSMAEKNS